MPTRSRPLVFVLVLVLALASLTGCGRSAAPESSSHGPAAPVGVGATTLASADRSLIVTMDVSVTVDRVDEASVRLRTAVEQAGGFVSDSRTTEQKTAHLDLRIPVDQAQTIRTTLGTLGDVTSATEKVEDVTEQRADIQARLTSARTQEKRLLELMAGKTSSISELMEVEKELARVRENVERLEAQERAMKSKVQLATVRVDLTARSVPAWQTPGESIVRSAKTGVQAASAISVCIAMMAATVGPTLLPILAVIAGIIVLIRRRRASTMTALTG